MISKRDSFSKVYKFLKNSNLKPFLGLGQRLAAEWEAFLGLKKSDYPSILVYQMGKVGSTSVSGSLKAAGLKNYVYDTHFLSQDLIKYKNFYIGSGIVPVPYHIDLGLALRKRILNNKFKKLKIISMVRDPIGRQISDVFQNPEIMEMDIKTPNGLIDKNRAMALIEGQLSDYKTFDYVFEWFNRELESVFGIDVFAKPFNRDSGWEIYNGENADALVIRMEDLSAVGENVISEFLNTPRKINLFQSNVRSQTPEAKAYSYVKNIVKVDKKLCKKVYSSQFVRHFYSDTQVEAMIERWSNGQTLIDD